MKSRTSSALLLVLLLAAAFSVYADSPPENTIPIISMKTGIESTCEDITMDALLRLLWQNFDGIWISGTFYNNGSAVVPATLCDSAGAYMIVAPTRLAALNFWPDLRRGTHLQPSVTVMPSFSLQQTSQPLLTPSPPLKLVT